MIISLVAVLLMMAVVLVLALLSPKPGAAESSYGSDTSFVENFSLATYRPMLRLASQIDRRFVSAAHSDSLGACYRKIQRGLLREYLRDASKDFNRLYAIATAKAVRATSDSGELSMVLFEQQMSFVLLIWGIEARLLLDGILPFAVDLGALMGHLEGLAQQTRELAQPRFGYQVL
jgi:hypothetical protein